MANKVTKTYGSLSKDYTDCNKCVNSTPFDVFSVKCRAVPGVSNPVINCVRTKVVCIYFKEFA